MSLSFIAKEACVSSATRAVKEAHPELFICIDQRDTHTTEDDPPVTHTLLKMTCRHTHTLLKMTCRHTHTTGDDPPSHTHTEDDPPVTHTTEDDPPVTHPSSHTHY